MSVPRFTPTVACDTFHVWVCVPSSCLRYVSVPYRHRPAPYHSILFSPVQSPYVPFRTVPYCPVHTVPFHSVPFCPVSSHTAPSTTKTSPTMVHNMHKHSSVPKSCPRHKHVVSSTPNTVSVMPSRTTTCFCTNFDSGFRTRVHQHVPAPRLLYGMVGARLTTAETIHCKSQPEHSLWTLKAHFSTEVVQDTHFHLQVDQRADFPYRS